MCNELAVITQDAFDPVYYARILFPLVHEQGTHSFVMLTTLAKYGLKSKQKMPSDSHAEVLPFIFQTTPRRTNHKKPSTVH